MTEKSANSVSESRRVLVVGSGGRESAIGWKIREDAEKSGIPTELFFSPGNAGTAGMGTNLRFDSLSEMRDWAAEEKMDLTIVGPEAELAEGVTDLFKEKGLKIFGPDGKSAQLESSKAFAKAFMTKYGVKTPAHKTFNGPMLAIEYLETHEYPVVVKASGLAAGKGVIICNDFESAKKAVLDIMEDKTFGAAGDKVVIEEYLSGFEASILSFFNGKEIVPFLSAMDHKKISDGETGLNTGGMGALAPNPHFTEEHFSEFESEIMDPTLKGLLEEELLFAGVVFFGLMVTEKGVYLLEYNIRFGDPEAQALLPLLESDLYNTVMKAIEGESLSLKFSDKKSCCVVMVSGGYPLNYEKGFEIRGLDKVDCPYFIAGAQLHDDRILTSGGRVIGVTGVGNTLEAARETAYANVAKIHFDYEYYRKDIGLV